MLKHVQISPMRNRSDSVSLRSTTSCASSLCGSPEPDITRTASRASSYSSLNDALPQTTIKVYTSCLKIDVEYKTLGIQWDTTSKEVVTQLLRRLKMRHRDPRLFYMSMEVTVRRAGIKTVLVLDEEARPAILQACHPKGDSRFCLQLRPGGLIRVHTSALQPTSQYKSLVISQETTADELLSLLLSCFNSSEPVEQFSIYEVCPGQEYQRKLHPDDLPLRAQIERIKRGETCHFLVRRNPNYPRRRQLLPPITEKTASTPSIHSHISLNSLDSDTRTICEEDPQQQNKPKSHTDKDNNNSNKSTTTTICNKCRNNFKSCEFCNKNPSTILNSSLDAYNPVYNVREIRTVNHSFSPLGSDKKILDVEQFSRQQMKSNGVVYTKRYSACDYTGKMAATLAAEAVNNNPAKGLGHYVYI
ncbi:uncharacterized protein LOC119652788 [Hermetia illucens]|nr:uncharacterized protein LOC119652788 [Hermetia illucens]